MRRVYGIYVMRQAMKPSVRLTAFLVLCIAIASSVSMPNIIANALHSSDLIDFSLVAITSTRFYVQLGVLAAGLLLIWTVFDALRPSSRMRLSV